MAWMFDNEIDWVMRIHCASPYQQAARFAEEMQEWMTRYKAEHKQWIVASRWFRQSVQSKKSVFRSAIKERVSVIDCSQADNLGYL
jgi:hypothetical protein